MAKVNQISVPRLQAGDVAKFLHDKGVKVQEVIHADPASKRDSRITFIYPQSEEIINALCEEYKSQLFNKP